MPVTVTVNALNFPTPLVDAGTMREIGDLAVRLITTRTQRGIDKKGAAFVAYTPGYAKVKAKELGAGPVNLTVSGRMLNDMAVMDATGNKVSLGFRSSGGRASSGTFIQRSRSVGAEDKARYHDQDGAGKSRVKREFFGLTAEDTEKIRAAVERHMDRVMQQINRR